MSPPVLLLGKEALMREGTATPGPIWLCRLLYVSYSQCIRLFRHRVSSVIEDFLDLYQGDLLRIVGDVVCWLLGISVLINTLL